MGDPLRLYGLNAVVLSGGSGIGEATARTLAKHGATVIAVDGNDSGVEQHYSSVKGISGLSTNQLDVDSLRSMIDVAADTLGGIDILVIDLPLPMEVPFSDVGKKLEQLLELRTALTLATSRAALPHLKKSPAGRIVNMGIVSSGFAANSSDASDQTQRNLASVTRAIAVELGEFGINANYVQPGGVMTPLSRDAFRKDPDLRDHCIRISAAQRLGEPVDIAKVVLFLASDDSVFVSGTGIAVDGGRTDG